MCEPLGGTPEPPRPEDPAERRFRALACACSFAALVCFASALTITPASLNEIAREFGVGASKLGGLFLAVTAGFLAGVTAAGRFSDRFGKLPFISLGCLLLAAGLVAFGHSHGYLSALASTILIGAGGGFSESSAMALVGDLYVGRRRTAMLNWAQAVFGIGAVLAPVMIAALLRFGFGWRTGYFLAAAAPALSSVVALAVAAARREKRVGHRAGEKGPRAVLSDPLVLRCSLAILLYVGAECGTAHWLAKYFRTELGASAPLAASGPAFFWGGVAAGRAAGAWVSGLLSEVSLSRWAIALAAAFQVVLLVSDSPLLGLPSAIAVGFFLGPVFPTIVGLAGAAHPGRSGAAAAAVIFSGAVGAAVFPPMVGGLADLTGLRAALWVCAAVLAVDLALLLRMDSTRRC